MADGNRPNYLDDYLLPTNRLTYGEQHRRGFYEQMNHRLAMAGVDLGLPATFPAAFYGSVNIMGVNGGGVWHTFNLLTDGIELAFGIQGGGEVMEGWGGTEYYRWWWDAANGNAYREFSPPFRADYPASGSYRARVPASTPALAPENLVPQYTDAVEISKELEETQLSSVNTFGMGSHGWEVVGTLTGYNFDQGYHPVTLWAERITGASAQLSTPFQTAQAGAKTVITDNGDGTTNNYQLRGYLQYLPKTFVLYAAYPPPDTLSGVTDGAPQVLAGDSAPGPTIPLISYQDHSHYNYRETSDSHYLELGVSWEVRDQNGGTVATKCASFWSEDVAAYDILHNAGCVYDDYTMHLTIDGTDRVLGTATTRRSANMGTTSGALPAGDPWSAGWNTGTWSGASFSGYAPAVYGGELVSPWSLRVYQNGEIVTYCYERAPNDPNSSYHEVVYGVWYQGEISEIAIPCDEDGQDYIRPANGGKYYTDHILVLMQAKEAGMDPEGY